MGEPARDVRPRDKVRITAGPYAGQRGVVEEVTADSLRVRLRDSQSLVAFERSELANFSAAARKAWRTMPSRRVGRPKGHTTNRVSVTLRVDRAMWNQFKSLERDGLIQERSAFLESLIAKELGRLEADKK